MISRLTVSDALIQALKSRVRIDTQQHKEERLFQTGEKVEILNGPFEGFEGIFDTRLSGVARVRILIELIRGKPVKVDLAASSIQKKKQKR